MESNKVGYWLQVGANVGILAGLVLVGFQINQSTELARFQMEQEWNASFDQYNDTMLGEAPAETVAKAIDDPESLTTAELIVFENYLNNFLEKFVAIKQMADLGLVPHSRWRDYFEEASTESYLTYVFGNQVSQAWWDVVSERGGWLANREFYAVVDPAIRRVGSSAHSDWHASVRSKLADRLNQ